MLGKIFNNKTEKDTLVVLLDVDSSSVSGAIVKNFSGHDKAPLVLYTYKKTLFFDKKVEPDEFIQKILTALRAVMNNVVNKNNSFGKIEKVHVFYGNPWYKNEIKNIQITEKTPKIFTSEYLKKFLKTQKTTENESIQKIERKIASVKINGYKINDPFGKKVSKLDLSFYESALDKETYKLVVDIIDDYIKPDRIYHHTHPFITHKVLSEKFDSVKNYSIFDISGELTEITAIRDGNFEKIISIPHGTHYFIREMMEKMHLDQETALSKLRMIISKEIDPKIALKNENLYKDIKKDWLDIFRKVFKNADIKSLPADLFILVDKEFEFLLKEILNDSEAHTGVLKFGRKPNITFINSASVLDLCHYESKVVKDPLVSLSAAFIEIIE